ncbi:hypothetical protein [Celeribacter sp.]|uniref:hypothetical protein n=1 Tax=Celeribacter sp. TaxID=1890673 RepID=UPI003A8EA2AB
MTVNLDRSPAAIERRRAEVDRRMSSVSATGEERNDARRRITSEIEAEDLKAAESAAAVDEANTERQRVAGIVRAGVDCGRPLQALRLALAGPVGVDQAKSILSALPLDTDAPEAALTLSEPAAFGGKAAQAERKRIGSIFAHPSAEGRFKSASALTLEGAEGIPVEAITAMLSGLPVDLVAPKYPSLEERDAEFASFGADDSGSTVMSKSEKIDAAWSRQIAAANKMIGAVDDAPRPSGQVISVEDDQNFGLASQMPGGDRR